MFNLASFEKKQQQLEDRLSRQKRTLTRDQKDTLMLRIYGKTRDDMADAYHDRVEEAGTRGGSMELPVFDDEKNPFTHTFRDRSPTMELGQKNGHVSGRTYVPRAVYKGAGVKVGDKPERWKSETPTVGLEEVPRISRAPFEGLAVPLRRGAGNPGPSLRIRQPEKEICPAMRFQAAVETERINDSVANSHITIPAPFDGGYHKVPVWRHEQKDHWVAGKLNLTHGPREGTFALTKSMSGVSYSPSISTCERFSPEIRQVERKRLPDAEIDPISTFVATCRVGETIPSKAKLNWNLQSEMSAAVQSNRGSRVYSQSTRATSGH